MTSFRQIEANRRNALRSTGPTTEEGKHRSRQNAVRHGLGAETVVETVEDIDDYRGFEAAVIADYDARTAVERELVLRLASLLWRLRRANAIETDLIRIQAEILQYRRSTQLPVAVGTDIGEDTTTPVQDTPQPIRSGRDLAHCFLRLANLDNDLFERLGRYESKLWRQMLQTLFALQSARRR
jgi:hypothetical protein